MQTCKCARSNCSIKTLGGQQFLVYPNADRSGPDEDTNHFIGTLTNCASSCNNDRYCLSATYSPHWVGTCWKKNSQYSYQGGGGIVYNSYKTYMEKCYGSPPKIVHIEPKPDPKPKPQPDPKEQVIKELKAKILKNCQDQRTSSGKCETKCDGEGQKDFELAKLKCEID